MKYLKNNCRRGDISITPADYKKLNSNDNLKKNWFVQCRFHDPAFADKYPKGFLYRKKINRFANDIQNRKTLAELVKSEMKHQLDDLHYNPITKTFSSVSQNELNQYTFLPVALDMGMKKISAGKEYVKAVAWCVSRVKPAIERLGYNLIEIQSVEIWHIKTILDESDLTDYNYNKFRSYLMNVFKQLIQYGCIDHNPCREIIRRKRVTKIRETLNDASLSEVENYLKKNNYTFYRYLKIFYYSGARSSELMRVKIEDVNLERQEFKVTIRKGQQYVETIKVITDQALPFWNELMALSENRSDYIFSRGLIPGEKKVQSYQITKRWYRLVKKSKELNITADFYSLKHLFLDKLSQLQMSNDNNLAQLAASHKSARTTSIYTVGKKERERELLKHIKI